MGRLWVRFPLKPEFFFHQSIKKWRKNLNRDEAPSKSLIRIPFFNLPIKFEFEPLSSCKTKGVLQTQTTMVTLLDSKENVKTEKGFKTTLVASKNQNFSKNRLILIKTLCDISCAITKIYPIIDLL